MSPVRMFPSKYHPDNSNPDPKTYHNSDLIPNRKPNQANRNPNI